MSFARPRSSLGSRLRRGGRGGESRSHTTRPRSGPGRNRLSRSPSLADSGRTHSSQQRWRVTRALEAEELMFNSTKGPSTPTAAATTDLPRSNTAILREVEPSSTERPRVYARFRPRKHGKDNESPDFLEFPSQDSVSISTDRDHHLATATRLEVQRFQFDHVFPARTTQKELYDHTVMPIIEGVFNGLNCTILAYGQTGSGKTYTMMGEASNEGIVPRLSQSLFKRIGDQEHHKDFTIKVSYIEVYMKNIKDLLASKAVSSRRSDAGDKRLRIRQSPQGVWVENATVNYVSSEEELLAVLAKGNRARSVAETMMNESSSRSHAIVIVTLGQLDVQTQKKTGSTLFLVDLAGSEKVRKSKAEGTTLSEARYINRSLSALGNVIMALTRGDSYVPYRDSKLTHLLSHSLGGNSRTSLIVTASSDKCDVEETISTLRFGARAKRVRNNIRVNEEYSIDDYKQFWMKTKAKCRAQEATNQQLIRGISAVEETASRLLRSHLSNDDDILSSGLLELRALRDRALASIAVKREYEKGGDMKLQDFEADKAATSGVFLDGFSPGLSSRRDEFQSPLTLELSERLSISEQRNRDLLDQVLEGKDRIRANEQHLKSLKDSMKTRGSPPPQLNICRFSTDLSQDLSDMSFANSPKASVTRGKAQQQQQVQENNREARKRPGSGSRPPFSPTVHREFSDPTRLSHKATSIGTNMKNSRLAIKRLPSNSSRHQSNSPPKWDSEKIMRMTKIWKAEEARYLKQIQKLKRLRKYVVEDKLKISRLYESSRVELRLAGQRLRSETGAHKKKLAEKEKKIKALQGQLKEAMKMCKQLMESGKWWANHAQSGERERPKTSAGLGHRAVRTNGDILGVLPRYGGNPGDEEAHSDDDEKQQEDTDVYLEERRAARLKAASSAGMSIFF